MKNSKQPIHPQMYTKIGDGEDDYIPLKDGQKTGWEWKYGGLTKREYFAGLAMQGLLANPEPRTHPEFSAKEVAEGAIAFADELLKQLES